MWIATTVRWTRPLRLAAALAVAGGWIGCQPEDERPGLWLRGESVEERIGDWRFARDVEEIFIETQSRFLIPHSVTIWCVELDGKLYIGSYGDEKKAWEKNLERNPEARLAIGDEIYDVTVTPVSDRDLVGALHATYAEKYDMEAVFGNDVPEWWYYHVARRGPETRP